MYISVLPLIRKIVIRSTVKTKSHHAVKAWLCIRTWGLQNLICWVLLIKETSWLKQIAELENNYPQILLSNMIRQIYTEIVYYEHLIKR